MSPEWLQAESTMGRLAELLELAGSQEVPASDGERVNRDAYSCPGSGSHFLFGCCDVLRQIDRLMCRLENLNRVGVRPRFDRC